MDDQIGRILEYLEQRDEFDDTLIVLTSDHGEMFHEFGLVTHGSSLHELQLRIPLLVHWPQRLPPRTVDAPISHLDVMPTVLDLLDLPPHPAFQGHSFLSPDTFSERRTGQFLRLQGLGNEDALICWPWKLVVNYTDMRLSLFDLDHDPVGDNDLFRTDHPVAGRLASILVSQRDAQLRYHAADHIDTYAPRLLSCDAMP